MKKIMSRNTLYILVIVPTVALIVFLIFIWLQPEKPLTPVSVPTTTDESAPSEPSTEEPVHEDKPLYFVQLTRTHGESEYHANPSLVNLLVFILALEGNPTKFHSNLISEIVYHTQDPSPYDDKLNTNYYVFPGTEINKLPTGTFDRLTFDYLVSEADINKSPDDFTEFDSFTAIVSLADQALIPYVKDENYCETDSDCSLAYSYCSYESLNSFRFFSDVYGCEEIYYPEENQDELKAACDPATEIPQVSYDGSKCEANQCVAQNPQISCQPGTSE